MVLLTSLHGFHILQVIPSLVDGGLLVVSLVRGRGGGTL